MKLAEISLAALVVGLAGFIGAQTLGQNDIRSHAEAAGAIDTRSAALGATAVRRVRSAGEDDRAPSIRLATEVPTPVGMPTHPATPFSEVGGTREIRRRIAAGAPGTYIDELLASRDSSLARWPERTTRPLRVWIDEPFAMNGWNADFASSVRDAFLSWSDAGIPMRFDFVRDSARADVHVRFLDRLPNGISGKTVWSRDARWWLVSSDIQLALVHPSGGVVTPPQMRAIALHEVGHLLGLDHSSGQDNIMASRVRVRELSEEDRATVRLLYSVPAGNIR